MRLALLNDDDTVAALIAVPDDWLAFQLQRHGGEGDLPTQQLRVLQAWSARVGIDNYRGQNSEYYRYHMERAGLTPEIVNEQSLAWLERQADKVAE